MKYSLLQIFNFSVDFPAEFFLLPKLFDKLVKFFSWCSFIRLNWLWLCQLATCMMMGSHFFYNFNFTRDKLMLQKNLLWQVSITYSISILSLFWCIINWCIPKWTFNSWMADRWIYHRLSILYCLQNLMISLIFSGIMIWTFDINAEQNSYHHI